MTLRRILPLLVISCVQAVNTSSSLAQFRSSTEPTEIRGQVRYAHGGTPAIDVVVRLDQLSGGSVGEVRTDRLGKFRFTNLLPIQYHVMVRHPGYQEILREVNLIMTRSEYLQLQLMPDNPLVAQPASSAKILDANVPTEARKEFEKSEVLLATGKKDKMKEATRRLEKALVIYPKFLEAQLRLGTAYMDLQQWREAEQVLLQALKNNPRTPNVLFALGELYLQEQKTSEAENVLRQGLEIEQRSWQGHFTLGRVFLRKGDIVNAGRQIAITLQLNPNLAEAHLLAGNILLRARKSEDALFEFEEYLRLAPKGKYAAQTREVVRKIKQARTARQ
jgi:Tfp pilus assembly protein PilF